jgi:hypothetical protein
MFKTWPYPTLQATGVLNQVRNSGSGTNFSYPTGLLITELGTAINEVYYIVYTIQSPSYNPYTYDLQVTSPTNFLEIMIVSYNLPALVVKVDGVTCGTAPYPTSMSMTVIQRVACGMIGT